VTYCIYSITNNLNRKRYIGFTGNFRVRKNKHKDLSRRGSLQAIHHAIRKYGWENFSWEILFESSDREQTLNVKEPEFIKLYQTQNPKYGYNQTAGGEHYVLSEEARHKISLSKLGKKRPPHVIEALRRANFGTKQSEERKARQSELLRHRYDHKPNPMKGRKLTEPHKQKLRAVHPHLPHTKTSKAKIAEKNSRHWTVVFPDGHQEQIVNMAKFCREHNLHQSNMSETQSNGKTYKGFKCCRSEIT
jgi:group I intron endonuclease